MHTRIKSINLPKSVTLVVPTAFAEASKLSKIEADVESEAYKSEKGGLYARDGGQPVRASRDAEKLGVPKGAVRIGDCAGSNCKNLVAASMPVGAKSIGLCSFFGRSSLECVDFPDSLKQIGDRAFENCSKLRRARISGKSEIDRGAGLQELRLAFLCGDRSKKPRCRRPRSLHRE